MKFNELMKKVKRDDGLYATVRDGGEKMEDSHKRREYVLWRTAVRVFKNNPHKKPNKKDIHEAFRAVVAEMQDQTPSFFDRWLRDWPLDHMTTRQIPRVTQFYSVWKDSPLHAPQTSTYPHRLTRKGFVPPTTCAETFGGVYVFEKLLSDYDLWGVVEPLLNSAEEVQSSEGGRDVFQAFEEDGSVKPSTNARMQVRLDGTGAQVAEFVKARLIERGAIAREAVVANEVTVLWNASLVMKQQAFHHDFKNRTSGFSVIIPLDGAMSFNIVPLKRPKESDKGTCRVQAYSGDAIVFEGDVNHAGMCGIGRVPAKRLHMYCAFPPAGEKREPGEVVPRAQEGEGLQTFPTKFVAER